MKLPRRKYRTLSIDVDIDADEVLSQISDDEVLEEVRLRGLGVHYFDRDYAQRAYEALTTRRYADAEAFLDRALAPFPTEQQLKGLMSLFAHAKEKIDRTNASGGTTDA